MEEKVHKYLSYLKKGKVVTISLNRPEKLNAINLEIAMQLKKVLSDFAKDNDIKAGIITGTGDKAFSVGGDIGMFLRLLQAQKRLMTLLKIGYDVHRLIEHIEKPLIAAVNGYCLAGGLEIALACDFIIASDDASLGLIEISIGIIPGWGGCIRLPRAISIRKAKEMIYTGELITAQEAERMGLVNKVVPKNQLYEAACELADKLASKSTLALRMAKNVINHAWETHGIDSALSIERGGFCVLVGGEDCKEGISAFLEKRPPSFK